MDDLFLNQLQEFTDSAGLIVDGQRLAPHLIDSRGLIEGKCLAMLRPKTTQELANIMKTCYEAGVAMVPQGGNTGRVGGATPDQSGKAILIELGRMNKIRHLDPVNQVMEVEAGVILANIQAAAEKENFIFPLSLGAQGSCMIGGNIASNAGGVHVIRYGNCRDLVMGIEAVLPDGRIWNGMRALAKDNSGYDLKHLFIGSEGTLGIITAANLKLYAKPIGYEAALINLPSLSSFDPLIEFLRQKGQANINALELISKPCLELVRTHFPKLSIPNFDADSHPDQGWMLLIEFVKNEGTASTLENLIEQAYNKELISNASLAMNETQRLHFWRIREAVVEAEKKEGKAIKHDICLKISDLIDFIRQAELVLTKQIPDIRICAFGHAGDGNLHYNLVAPMAMTAAEFMTKKAELTKIIHELTLNRNGSIAAEHGIGQTKKDEMFICKSDIELSMMVMIKNSFDPKNLMNPGKLIPINPIPTPKTL